MAQAVQKPFPTLVHTETHEPRHWQLKEWYRAPCQTEQHYQAIESKSFQQNHQQQSARLSLIGGSLHAYLLGVTERFLHASF